MANLQEHYYQNDNKNMLLRGKSDENLIIFVHGYGSSPLDLMPLAKQINNDGIACAILLLDGHAENTEALAGKDYNTWLTQITEEVKHYKKTFSNILLVGFSLGATLCIDASQNIVVNGVVGISTFLELKSPLHKFIMTTLKIMNINRFPRLLQVTKSVTKHELDSLSFLPRIETEAMIQDAKKLIHKNLVNDNKILLLHSIDDNVADYEIVRKLRISNNNIKLITLRGLNHFLQFDIPAHKLSNLIKVFFFQQEGSVKISDDVIRADLENILSEFNHWSGLLFKLIVGFFTIFGALVYFSLPDILQNKPSAPYYLTSYSIVNSLFIILASMYFFYVNRANAYMKHILEPHLTPMPWVTYRTNAYISGKESVFITNRVSVAVIGTPLIISAGSLMYLSYRYTHAYLANFNSGMLLIYSLMFALILFVFSVSSLVRLSKYSNRELYYIHPECFHQQILNDCISSLYQSIEPGCVRQLKKND